MNWLMSVVSQMTTHISSCNIQSYQNMQAVSYTRRERARHFDIEMCYINKVNFLNNLETVNIPLSGEKKLIITVIVTKVLLLILF